MTVIPDGANMLPMRRVTGLDEGARGRLAAAASLPGLRLLVLFGSRARGDRRPDSDWDFGYVASAGFRPEDLVDALSRATGSDQVDLVDLQRAGGLLRYRAARDGVALFDPEGLFDQFWIDAVTFWCDAAAVLLPAYEGVLSRLGP